MIFVLLTPLLEVNAVCCNCSNFPATDKVLLPPVDETPESGNSPQPPAGNEMLLMPQTLKTQTRMIVSQVNQKVWCLGFCFYIQHI